jgi:hypothetical protein
MILSPCLRRRGTGTHWIGGGTGPQTRSLRYGKHKNPIRSLFNTLTDLRERLKNAENYTFSSSSSSSIQPHGAILKQAQGQTSVGYMGALFGKNSEHFVHHTESNPISHVTVRTGFKHKI